jgi:hypothetical protein
MTPAHCQMNCDTICTRISQFTIWPSEKKQNGIGHRAERHERHVREMPGGMNAGEHTEELALARRRERNARIAEDDPNSDEAVTKRTSAVIATAAAWPAARSANVRSMNTDAIALVCCASVHGMHADDHRAHHDVERDDERDRHHDGASARSSRIANFSAMLQTLL